MGTATNIPTSASPVISPEAMSKPFFFMVSVAPDRSLKWAIIPPIKMGTVSSMGRYIPTATAKIGTRKSEPILFCRRSIKIMITPIIAPNPTMVQGRFPVNTPSATDFINVACGADKVGEPIVYAV